MLITIYSTKNVLNIFSNICRSGESAAAGVFIWPFPFLCYKNEDCSGTKCNLSSEDDEVGFFSKVYNYIFGNNNLTDPHSDL